MTTVDFAIAEIPINSFFAEMIVEHSAIRLSVINPKSLCLGNMRKGDVSHNSGLVLY